MREQRLREGGLFVPLVFSFAASLEQLSPEEFLSSPTKLANGLRTVFASFGVDGLVGWCDNTAPAADLGCRLDWSTYPPVVEAPPGGACGLDGLGVEGATGVAAEVVRRLGSLLPDTVLVGTMPGPVTLARHLTGAASGAGGDAAKFAAENGPSERGPAPMPDLEQLRVAAKACLAYVKALGDAGLDVLLVCEDHLLVPDGSTSPGDIARLYSSIWNTARFYGLAALLTLGEGSDLDPSGLAPLAGVVDGLVAPPSLPAACRDALGSGLRRVGLALPAELTVAPADTIAACLQGQAVGDRLGDGLFLVTTDGEVPPGVDRAALIVGIEAIRDHLKEGRTRGA